MLGYGPGDMALLIKIMGGLVVAYVVLAVYDVLARKRQDEESWTPSHDGPSVLR